MSEPIDSDERNELDALRLENDTLRRNLGRLEEKVQRAEEHSLAHAQSPQQPTGPEIFSPRQSAPLEVHQLHGILQWLDKAKADIVNNDRTKIQLEGDVRLLYSLLERAKRERKSYEAVVGRLERSVAAADAEKAKAQRELELQRRSLKRVLKKDRDVYEARTEAAEEMADRRAEELKSVMTWVTKAESKYAEALGKLSAQAEEVGAANLGDLEGFARDMSAEIQQIRDAVAKAMRPQSSSFRSNVLAKGVRKAKDLAEAKEREATAKGDYSTTTRAPAVGTRKPSNVGAHNDAVALTTATTTPSEGIGVRGVS